MSRVRIEIYPDDEDFNKVQYAEAQYPDVREAFERAVAMARVALPEPPRRETILTLNNVKFTETESGVLFGQAIPPNNYTVQVTTVGGGGSGGESRRPCGETCAVPDEECTDTCARPAGHDDWHVTADGACTWGPEEGEGSAQLCLNEIGAPSKTRNCHQKLGHDGHCDGEQDALMDGLRPPLCTGTFEYKEEGKWLRRADCQRPLNHKGDCGRAVL